MSKSLGNFTNLIDLIERYDPRAYRLLVLRAHYRSPVDVTADDHRPTPNAPLDRLDAFARRVAEADRRAGAPDSEVIGRSSPRWTTTSTRRPRRPLLFDTVRRANAALDDGDGSAAPPLVAAANEIAVAFGLVLGAPAAEDEVPERSWRGRPSETPHGPPRTGHARMRSAMRCTADGWLVEDTPGGTDVRRG